MTVVPISLADLEATRERLISDVRERLDSTALDFLISLHDGVPDFDVIGLPQAAALPAIRWKLLNLKRLRDQDSIPTTSIVPPSPGSRHEW